jgi:tripartite-type tricarboxylate transporter receptor subunit TctC
MTLLRRQFLQWSAVAAAIPAVSRLAGAQAYPNRPITFIVPYPAGGPLDTISRILAESMRESLGQPIIIENVSGGGGSVGTRREVRAAPDGYTVAMGTWGSHVANGALYSLPYDVVADFEPVSLLPIEPNLIVAKNSLPAQNLREFLDWLKTNQDKAMMGTSGVGGSGHVAGLLFQKDTGTRFQLVPYRGVVPSVQDLISGQIDFVITGTSVLLAQSRAGTVKCFAIAMPTRAAAAAEIPTTDESGLPGYYSSVWQGMWMPKGTPKDIVVKLNAAVRQAYTEANVRQRFLDLALEIPTPEQQTVEAFAAFHKAEVAKWWPIIKAANIKME